MADDAFELYDLRVEVVAPPGATIQCNAQPGDSFEVRGEMLRFRPGRVSRCIRWPRCCRCCRPSSAPPTPNDWMSTDAEVACPDPHCPTRFRITRLGKRGFRHGETTRRALAAARTDDDRDRTLRAGARLPHPAHHPRRLAAGRRPRRGRPRRARWPRSRAFVDAGLDTFDCADIYTGVEELIRRLQRRDAARPGAACRCRCTPSACPTTTTWRARRGLRPPHRRPVAAAAAAWSGSTWCSSTGGTTRVPGCVEAALALARCSAKARSAMSAAPTSTRRTRAAMLRRRRAAGPHAGAVLAARPPARARRWSRCARAACVAVLRHAGRRLLLRALARRARARAELTNRSLIKYKLVIDEFGGWAAFQALLRALKAIGDRHGVGIATRGHALGARPAGRGRRHRRRALCRPSARHAGGVRAAPRRGRPCAAGADPGRAPRARRATPTAWSATRPAAHGRIMKYNLNKS